jgi:hypothetical protein
MSFFFSNYSLYFETRKKRKRTVLSSNNKENMKKEKVKNLIFTLAYLVFGSLSFIVSGIFFHAAYTNSSSHHILRAGLFCAMGLFWLYMFGEKRKETVFAEEDDLFFGSKIDDAPSQ